MALSTEFIDAVYQAVAQVPNGTVASYGQIAELAGHPGYARHVGKLLSQLPNDSNLPWHRIVKASGEIAFDVGSDQFIRQLELLNNEQVTLKGNRIAQQYFL